jgi:hypothetical protein
MGRCRVAAGAALAAAGLAASGCGGGAGTPEGATASFFQALGDGKAKDACALVPPDSRAQVFGQLVKGGARSDGSDRSCQEVVDNLSPQQKKLFANVIADPSPDSAGRTVIARFEDDNASPKVPYAVSLAKDGDEFRLRAINEGGAP